jgi:hypothetical protein
MLVGFKFGGKVMPPRPGAKVFMSLPCPSLFPFATFPFSKQAWCLVQEMRKKTLPWNGADQCEGEVGLK